MAQTSFRASESPAHNLKRDSDLNNETIVQQITTPYLAREAARGSTTHFQQINTLVPPSQPYQRTVYSNLPQQQYVIQELTNSQQTGRASQANTHNANIQQIQGTAIHQGQNIQAEQVILPNKLVDSGHIQAGHVIKGGRRVQYVPYEQKYIEYVEQRVRVPVQRVCTDYYQVEHIIDYVPIQKQEIVYETQPKEVVTMRLQYVPVEQKIIHISEKNSKILGINQNNQQDFSSMYQQVLVGDQVRVEQPVLQTFGSQGASFSGKRSRTNFVTSEGYDPEANIREIDRLLTASSVRGSRLKNENDQNILDHFNEGSRQAPHIAKPHTGTFLPVQKYREEERERVYHCTSFFGHAWVDHSPRSCVSNSNLRQRYPLDPEFRQYQQDIVAACICQNSLVCLPTGLGKTHIAAVLLANFSRWFPDQICLFLAPTRPLVRQQANALSRLADQVPPEIVLEVSGQLAARKRQQLYTKHRVIFATPQTIENDLKQERLDGKRIILIIFDECHRAVGNASYAQIVRQLNKINIGFRIVGLSATPGSEPQKIQEVIGCLCVAKLLSKDESDPEVQKHMHQRIVNQVCVKQAEHIMEAMTIINEFGAPSIGMLLKLKLIQPWVFRRGLLGTSFFTLRKQFEENVTDLLPSQKNMAYSALRILSFLLSAMKNLGDQGCETFRINFFTAFGKPTAQSEDSNTTNRSKTIRDADSDSNDEQNEPVSEDTILNILKIGEQVEEGQPIENDQKIIETKNLPKKFRVNVVNTPKYRRLWNLFHSGNGKGIAHPKLLKLAEILENFFKSSGDGKAMVFTNLKLSAKQIQQFLQNINGVKAAVFFGQSKTIVREQQDSGPSFVLQLRQKDQLQVIQRYKKGEINTLVATCIGEQGLDIGEVDCIVCYDGGHSPIRSIQRRGRTGRKRNGEVHILLMEGKEFDSYKAGMKQQTKMKKSIAGHPFTYFAYNSSLFEENSQIKIIHYHNDLEPANIKNQEKIQSKDQEEKQKKENEEKSKQNEDQVSNQEGKKTKPKKKRKSTVQKKTEKSHQQQKQEEVDSQPYQFKYTKNINSLLAQYQEEEKEEELQQIQKAKYTQEQQYETLSCKVGKYTISFKQEIDAKPSENDQWNISVNHQQETMIIQNQVIDQKSQQEEQINESCQDNESDESDELLQQFQMYQQRKKISSDKKQQTQQIKTTVIAECESDYSSMSSDEAIEMLMRIKGKPKPLCPLDFQDNDYSL